MIRTKISSGKISLACLEGQRTSMYGIGGQGAEKREKGWRRDKEGVLVCTGVCIDRGALVGDVFSFGDAFKHLQQTPRALSGNT